MPYLDTILKHLHEETSLSLTKNTVLEWMASDDINDLGATAALIDNTQHRARIEPPLTSDDLHRFYMKYFRMCLLENPQAEWPENRYQAGWRLARLTREYWSAAYLRQLDDLKEMLAELYKNGDEALRSCIITAVLEHVFEVQEIVPIFGRWAEDSLLAAPYQEAIGYAREILEHRKETGLPDPFKA